MEAADITVSDVVTGLVPAVGAVPLACLALYRCRLPVLRRGYEPTAAAALIGPPRMPVN